MQSEDWSLDDVPIEVASRQCHCMQGNTVGKQFIWPHEHSTPIQFKGHVDVQRKAKTNKQTKKPQKPKKQKFLKKRESTYVARNKFQCILSDRGRTPHCSFHHSCILHCRFGLWKTAVKHYRKPPSSSWIYKPISL